MPGKEEDAEMQHMLRMQGGFFKLIGYNSANQEVRPQTEVSFYAVQQGGGRSFTGVRQGRQHRECFESVKTLPSGAVKRPLRCCYCFMGA